MAIAVINPTTGITERTFEPHGAKEIERRLALATACVG
jgi:succinate-semialdehyde dehydrogenase/glutarate-semialdehyde dehydrogenase